MDSEDGRLVPEALEALDYADESPGALEVPVERLQKCLMPAGFDYEELGGLLDPGHCDTLGVCTVELYGFYASCVYFA